jgi:hypothetical protein
MPLLPAVVPEIPENRAEVAAARLARKIAPLFGVPWVGGPFGGRTWVCDYAKITLSEIARGAPLPTRADAERLHSPDDGTWQVVERIGMAGRHASLPNEIANATLNRFGPDTRAAVVLTAVNRLLAPVQEAIEDALPLLVERSGAPVPARLRLAAWAGLVVETFRSQPALLAAGIHARAIQHELVQSWQLPLAAGLGDLPLTRCEVGSSASRTSTAAQPSTLDVADRTFSAMHLAALGDGDGGDGVSAELAARLHDAEAVDLLLRRLLASGTSADASYLWLSEREPGQLAVEALLPPTGVVDRFVRHAMRSAGSEGPGPEPPCVLPAIPATGQLAALPVLSRRAVLLALTTVLRHIQSSPQGREGSRHEIVPVLAAIGELAREALDPDDPVAALTACRVADMAVQTLRPDLRNDLRAAVGDLMAGLDRCEDLLRRGLLDRGAAAEAISSACVELNAVRRTNALRSESGIPSPEALGERLRHSWIAYHDALEIPIFTAGTDLPRLPRLAGYHLQNYAAYLAGSTAERELRDAVELFRKIVIPAREEFVARSGHFLPLRNALQVASRATTRLAEAARERGADGDAMHWAELGRDWIRRTLEADETRQLLGGDPPTESACRFALLAAPALLLAAELGAPWSDPGDAHHVAGLLDLVSRWEAGAVGRGEYHTRHEEVTALAARLAALTGPRRAGPSG